MCVLFYFNIIYLYFYTRKLSKKSSDLGSPISSEDETNPAVAGTATVLDAAIVPPDAEPVSPPVTEAEPPTPTDLPSGSPVTPVSTSAPDLPTEAVSPDSRSSSRQDANHVDHILLSPHTPPLPPKAYEKYIPESHKRKALEDDEDRRHKRKKRSRKESESPK